ncbi:hypothetical protein OAR83_00615 [Alphaproteobacteria bacterium]|nr:hypothetical protein [Alphaproteobacteria bacterium]
MNNNNFALLRYLIKRGIEAELLLLANDGKSDYNSHFTPENDSWDCENWYKYFKYTRIYEHPLSGLNAPLSIILWLYYVLIRAFGRGEVPKPISKKYLRKVFQNYDFIIGSGISPAVLNRIGRRVDIFYPFAMGVEYLEEPVFLNFRRSKNIFKRYFSNLVANRQLSGLRVAGQILNFDFDLASDALNRQNIPYKYLPIPLLYREKNKLLGSTVSCVAKNIQNSSFTFLSHARHIWKKPNNIDNNDWVNISKNNDYLISAFKSFVDEVEPNAILILLKYGVDFGASQKLCHQLQLEKNVIWLERMARKDLLNLIELIDVGIGEFYGNGKALWGGTLIEFASCGKTVIHGALYDNDTFQDTVGIEPPPILRANSSAEIFSCMKTVFQDRKLLKKLNKNTLNWYNDCYGHGLADKWVEEIKRIYNCNLD